MKKIIAILLVLLCLVGCQDSGKKDSDPNQRYLSIIDAINEYDSFSSGSNYFSISGEMAKINEGYRYYITIDSPVIALYDVEAVAIEKNVDYTNKMAANVGIFEDEQYCMIPNQKNPDKGFVSGLVISGTSEKSETTLYVYVSFKNEDYSYSHMEYLKVDVKYEEQ